MSTFIGEELMKTMLGSSIFSHYLDNYKPSWLNGLELDRYYPALRIAFEFQGEQHTTFSFSKHNNHDDFFSQYERDASKKAILTRKKITLVEYNASELSPPIFSSKLSAALPQIPEFSVDDMLHKAINKYQQGLQIHFKRELKNLLVSTRYYDFAKIPKLDEAIDRFFKISNVELSLDEKRCFCILTLLSRENQVLFNTSQLFELFPKLCFEENIPLLMEKQMISLNKTFGLITLSTSEFLKCYRFIHSLLLYMENHNRGTIHS